MVRGLSVYLVILCGAWVLIPGRAAPRSQRSDHHCAAHDSPLEAGIGPVQLRGEEGVVIRDAEQLVARSAKPDSAKDPTMQKEMEAELAKVLDVSAIDWSKQMVLALRGNRGRSSIESPSIP